MSVLARLTTAFHGRSRPGARGASGTRTAPRLRPSLETLESIDLLSTVHVHAMAAHRAAKAQVARSAGIQPILPLNYGVTGVRQDVGGNVLITGGTGAPSLKDGTPAFLYYGPLGQIPSTAPSPSLYTFNPTFAGQTVTSSQFYGPNTSLFDPSLGAGNITAVGAYRYTGSSFQAGMIYTGPVDGSGSFTPIVAPGNGTDAVGDTIPHSTMGDLVVGNFDYQDDQVRGHGFIYNKSTKAYTTVDIGRFSTTIYGVWQDGGPSSSHYTIVGGFSDNVRGAKAFIENYDAATGVFSRFRSYSFNNRPSIVTHFEGISAVQGGFSIAATAAGGRSNNGASYAFIPVRGNGSFGPARWVAIKNNVNGTPTTGDTVIDNSVMGIYPAGSAGASSYIATVKRPSIGRR
ncbi:hypothetical protein OJF2_73800 [Aquisphaera giovannonii]|uniref:Uncharacterized protein n=1 Tax=Aquisphaera giovannonii TaxID=406548 RepID=A0A5B9WEW9_9BACT|nr:hypothetical protein [Aquisphaera giovannonii]QEH38774.1 hypothetical protein OJF2_73800 [Aquisphaera giovannonii]